jgi:hypothetical protein
MPKLMSCSSTAFRYWIWCGVRPRRSLRRVFSRADQVGRVFFKAALGALFLGAEGLAGGARDGSRLGRLGLEAGALLDQGQLDFLDRHDLVGHGIEAFQQLDRASRHWSPLTMNFSPRRKMVTSSAAEIWRRFSSSGPQRWASRVLSSGSGMKYEGWVGVWVFNWLWQSFQDDWRPGRRAGSNPGFR